MELIERVQRFKRNIDFEEDPNAPWYKRKKNLMLFGIVGLVLVGVLILFFGGYFAGLSAHKELGKDSVPDPEPRVLLPLEWDGVCPKKTGKCPESYEGVPPLILVSLDGFHPDFMERGFTPTIKNISKCGTHAPYMFPVFPSKTFPNHFSQVTGLYPATHGIVDNNMYDPIRRKLFKVGTTESLNPSWWLKEPIWVTAQKQGKKAACYYWPGSEVQINGSYPTYYKKYNAKISFDSRVDQVLAWLNLPIESRPQLLTLYVNQPDHTLHAHGTKAKQVDDVLAKVDRMIERLFASLQQQNLINCVNVIIMADHGMSDTDCKHLIELQKYINVNDTFSTIGPYGRLRPKGKHNATLINDMLSKLRCINDHMRAYAKEQLPVRMHYADNRRIEPIFLDLDAGWTVISKSLYDEGICTGGSHGYDNMFRDMRAIFLAHGPSFKKNYTMQPFINIELYEMLTELIDIVPNPNNGTRGSMHYILNSPRSLPPQKEPISPAIAMIPDDDKVYNERLSASSCSCAQTQKQVQVKNDATTRDLHLPFGVPYSAKDNSSIQLLYEENYISAFSLKYKIPLWSAFSIKGQTDYKMPEVACWAADARIHPDNVTKCSDYTESLEKNPYILQRPLNPPGFSGSTNDKVVFITNSIAKSLNHSKLEEPFYQLLNQWASQSGEMNIMTGPAFDIFATGLRPNSEEFMKMYAKKHSLLISTHIFVIATWCSTIADSLKSCDPSNLKANGFLLPNQPFPVNCEDPTSTVAKNVARIVDIENLTGISFYTGLPIYDAIRLRTMMPERAVTPLS